MALFRKTTISASFFASVGFFVLLLSNAMLNAKAQVPGPPPPGPPGPSPPGPPGPSPPSPTPAPPTLSPPSPGPSPGPSPPPKPPGPSCLFNCASTVISCVLKCKVSDVICYVRCGTTAIKCITACDGKATEDQISPIFGRKIIVIGRKEAAGTETSTIEAQAMIMSTAGGSKIGIKGSLHFRKNSMGEKTQINGRLLGLSPGTHGLSIYSTPSCESVKAHFNPLNKDHGAPCDENHHAGHLGNIVASPDGIARVSIDAKTIQLKGDNSVLGMAIVVHADEDDLGRGGNKESKMTGNSGAAVGCGIIGIKPSFKNHVK